MSEKARWLAVLLAGIALILGLLALQLIFPGEVRLHQTSGDAVIDFSAERRLLFAPGACVTVHWQVDHIRAVYVNRTPAVGAGQASLCVDETAMPVLSVTFTDNTSVDFPLKIEFLTQQPSTWLLVSAAILLALASLVVAASRPAAAQPRAETRRAPRFVSFFAGVGLVVTGVAITLAVLELGLRFYFTRFGSEFQRIAYVDSRAQIDALQAATIPLPFVEYGLSPGYTGHDPLGYRGGDIQIPKPPGVYRIVAIGGSTTYGTAVPADESYPYDLQQTLRSAYGLANVEVVNAGVAGYTSWNDFVNLALRVTTLNPDLVIFYDATNDVLPREVSPDCYSALSPFLGLDPRRQLLAQPEPLSLSALYRFVAINAGWMPNPAAQGGATVTSPIPCDDSSDVAHNVEVNRPVYYERNQRYMTAIAGVSGFRMMFASWAYDHNSADALPFWRTAVDEHNAITARVAQETGSLYLDYAAIAPGTDDSYWSDYIHMNAKGNQSQAEAFAKFLVDQGVIGNGS